MALVDLFGSKFCKRCKTIKPVNQFFKKGACRTCVRKRAEQVHSENPEIRKERARAYRLNNLEAAQKRSTDFYNSVAGRASSMVGSAARRSKVWGTECDLSRSYVESLILAGRCSVTGIPFVLDKNPGTMKNPYSPSLDRIDSNGPYTKANVRIVIWQYNLMKGELSDNEVRLICQKVLGL